MRFSAPVSAAVAVIVSVTLLGTSEAPAETVNLYSARKEALIRPLLNAFTVATGIDVRTVTANGGQLHQRLIAEGENSPADVLLTVDAGNLWRAAADGLLRSIRSERLEASIPAEYRDPDGQWFGLSLRARAVVYSKDRVGWEQLARNLAGYMNLADPVWRGKITVRSSSNIYNQSLLAAIIGNYGPEAAEEWVRGLVSNLARPPSGGDRDQIRAVAAGEADLAIVNSYYYAALLESEESSSIANTAIYFPADEEMGTHVNVSGAGVTRYAPHPEAGVALIEYLASPEAQAIYAAVNHEFPANPDVDPSGTLAEWGSFTADDLAVAEFGRLNAEAVRTADRAGWK